MKTILNLIILILWQAYLMAQQIIVDEVNNIGIQSTSLNTAAVYGISKHSSGILGSSTYLWGVRGASINADGTIGQSYSTSSNHSGVCGYGIAARGVTGQSATGIGVYGTSTGGYGVYGKSTDEIGVLGESTHSYGVWGNGKTYDFYAWKEDGSVAYGQSSSRRWKTNIINIPNPLEKMAQLRGVYFDWNPDHGGLHDVGFIAEEIGAVMPEIVGYEENGIDATGMDYSKMTPLLVEAANAMRKEYQEKFNAQKQLNDKLIAANESIRKEMAELKQLIKVPMAKVNLTE
ncbi:MAG: tail fiber domain-containing protein [Saprospiraceae bacterium]|nr:tail fiber domain-containing protein [Saprospiraceae bacterium]